MRVARDLCAVDPGRAIMKVDIANAFNSVSRLSLRKSLESALTSAEMQPVLAAAGLPGVEFRTLDKLVVLSVPLGPPAFCATVVEEALRPVLKDLKAIAGFANKHVALCILHDCLAFGPAVYFMRLVEPSAEVLRVYERFDAAIRQAFTTITAIAADPSSPPIPHLDFASQPTAIDIAMWQIGVKRGGLGLRSVERHAPLAYFASLRYAVQEVHGSSQRSCPPASVTSTSTRRRFSAAHPPPQPHRRPSGSATSPPRSTVF
jgi:hypothetical protein